MCFPEVAKPNKIKGKAPQMESPRSLGNKWLENLFPEAQNRT